MSLLEIKNIIKKFDGVCAVNDLSIKIEKAKITGLIGPNGSGKTTLIHLLSGMLRADRGDVIVSGAQNIARIPPYQISSFGITRTFQNVRLFEQMTVLDNILVVVTQRNVYRSFFERHTEHHLKVAEEVLQKIGLWEKRDQLAITLSYGQRKLLEIARTLAMKAEVYLFDEPFAGLFPEMRKLVSSIMQELKQQNKTIILIEHDMGLMRWLCDYIFVMDEGKLLTEGTPNHVLEKREVIEAYLGE
jgi:branched-chain amino acid transport system ATP-binding protein